MDARADTRAEARAETRPAQQARTASPPQITLRTPAGDITLRTPLPIPEGARVAVDVASTKANQVTVRFVSLNGQPIQQALVQLAADRAAPLPPGAAPPVATGPLGQAGPTPLSFGQVWTPGGALGLTQAGPLNAFVLAGTPQGQTATPQTLGHGPGAQHSPGTQAPLLTGSDLTIRITAATPGQPGATPAGVTTPQVAPNTPAQANAAATPQAATGAQFGPTGQTTQTQGATPIGAAPQASAQTAQATQPAQGPGATLPAGGSAQSGLKLVSAQGWPPAPLSPPSNVQTSPVRLALTGVVTAQSTASQTVIQTGAGTLQLANRVNLPPGTTVTLDIMAQTAPRTDAAGAPVTAPPTATAALPFATGALATGAAPWPTLTEALQVMQRSDPQAGQLLANTIPDGGPRTVVAALSFIQAMRNGDPRQWPGDNNLRALERSSQRGAHLARTISSEVAQLSAQSREATGEWRSTPIPWNAEGQIEKINLITRREDPPDEDEKEENSGKKGGLRFLLDLDLTNLGALQLDGMVREDTNGFDLMIRSHNALDDIVRRDLTGLFIATNQAVGLKGQLTFQVTQKFADPISAGEPIKQQRDGMWA